MADNDSGWSFTAGFLIGAIAGGIAGVLLAPKPGAETRAQLVQQSETWRTRAEEAAASVRERVGPTVDEIRDRVQPVAEHLSARVEQVGAKVGLGSAGSTTDGGPSAESPAPETTEDKKKA